MFHPLRYQQLARPDATFIQAWDDELTFGDAIDEAGLWAATFREAGVGAGQRVAIVGDNSIDWVKAALGAWNLGATLVPINARLLDDQIEALLDDIEIDAVVSLGKHAERRVGPRPQFSTPMVRDIVEPQPIGLETVATIFFTSGTTGRPKAVPHTWGQHIASSAASAFNLGVYPSDKWLCALPLFHIGGLAIVIRSLLYGTTVTLHDEFSVSRAIYEFANNHATLGSFVPTMLHRILEHEDAADLEYSSLRGILLGGGPATSALLERAAALQLPVFQTYGMTEAASQITTVPPAAAASRVGSAGLPVQGADVVIRADDGTASPAGTVGNIWVRGPMITSGYLNRPEANERLFRDGWFHTGDFGHLDDDGFLWVATRRDDLIVSGGENVYPAEIESVLSRAEGVDEVAIVGQEDSEWGQRVVAYYVGSAEQAELEAFARANLGAHQIPRAWHRLEELPRTVSGKILRRELR